MIGNPLIAITMLRHDVTAGLFAPVELLLARRKAARLTDLRRPVDTHGRRTQPTASVGGARTRRQARRAGHQGDRGLNQRRELRRHSVQSSKRVVARLGRKVNHEPFDTQGCVALRGVCRQRYELTDGHRHVGCVRRGTTTRCRAARGLRRVRRGRCGPRQMYAGMLSQPLTAEDDENTASSKIDLPFGKAVHDLV